MKKKKQMNDAERLSYWDTVSDPLEALKEIVENSWAFGYDPYYGDQHVGLINMAERIVGENSK